MRRASEPGVPAVTMTAAGLSPPTTRRGLPGEVGRSSYAWGPLSQIVTTTLPGTCPSSWYVTAARISSNG